MGIVRVSCVAAAGLAAASLLASCAGGGKRPIARSAPRSYPVVQPLPQGYAAPVQAPPGLAPSGAAMGSSDAVLRLRAGLNVAALSCRGHGMAPVTAAYGDLLNRHRTLLASAYDEERRRHGLTAFDRQQTRLYNRFANQQSPETFCRSAAAIAGQANSMASSSLAAASPRLAAALEAQLR